ncbi:MAG: NUDIX hydrolase, partial [Sphaerochaetaceae bacterium]|nr:NUDIX hydrolase [Sphaerochaetaceae bacterium]
MRFPYKGAGIMFYCVPSDTSNLDIYNDVKIIVGKRTKKLFKDTFTISGGGFEKEKDKTYWETALRETKEEIGYMYNGNGKDCFTWKLLLPFFSWTTFFCSISLEEGKTIIKNAALEEFSMLRLVSINELKSLKTRPFTKREI